jgi:hypothetical protein
MKKIILLLFLSSCGYINESKEVAWQETRPQVLLKKYMYFKDLSSTIDNQRANLIVYQEELKDSTLLGEYKQQRKSEAIGIAMNYNGLVAKYNSEMSKVNYAFCNIGQLPQSNLEPLPREFKPFILTIK